VLLRQGEAVSRRVPLKEEQFPLFLVKVLYYTQALLLFNAIDKGLSACLVFVLILCYATVSDSPCDADANRRLDLEEFRIALPLLHVSDVSRAQRFSCGSVSASIWSLASWQLPNTVNVERLFHDLDDNSSGVVR
jgi:hypothetical protein